MRAILCVFICVGFAVAEDMEWGVSDEADFAQLDTSADGFVSLEEVNEWNAKFGAELGFDLSEDEINAGYTEEDTDGDGKVSIEEFKAGRARRAEENRQLEMEGMTKLFKNADFDGDAQVTLDAMVWTARNWTGYLPVFEEHLKRDFTEADIDRDGIVTMSEWDAFRETAHEMSGQLVREVEGAIEAKAQADVAMQEESDVAEAYGKRRKRGFTAIRGPLGGGIVRARGIGGGRVTAIRGPLGGSYVNVRRGYYAGYPSPYAGYGYYG